MSLLLLLGEETGEAAVSRLLDGVDDCIEFAHNVLTNAKPVGAITLLEWVRPASAQDSTNSLVHKIANNGSDPFLSYALQQGTTARRYGGGLSTGVSGSLKETANLTATSANVWQLFVLRWDTADNSMVVERRADDASRTVQNSVSTTTFTGNIGYTNHPLVIGRNEGTAHFTGHVALIAIFDVDLSDANLLLAAQGPQACLDLGACVVVSGADTACKNLAAPSETPTIVGGTVDTGVVPGNGFTYTLSGGSIALTGIGSGASGATGTLKLSTALVAIGSASVGATGVLRVLVTGSGASSNSAAGVLSLQTALVGSVAAASGSTGLLQLRVSGSGASSSSATGTLTVTGGPVALTGIGSSSSGASGALSLATELSGSAATANACSGILTLATALSGHADASDAAIGNMGGTLNLTGSAGASSSATGTLSLAVALSGSGAGSSQAVGTLGLLLLASAANATSASGSLSVLVAIAGVAQAANGASGALGLLIALQAGAASASGASGIISLGGPVSRRSTTPTPRRTGLSTDRRSTLATSRRSSIATPRRSTQPTPRR